MVCAVSGKVLDIAKTKAQPTNLAHTSIPWTRRVQKKERDANPKTRAKARAKARAKVEEKAKVKEKAKEKEKGKAEANVVKATLLPRNQKRKSGPQKSGRLGAPDPIPL